MYISEPDIMYRHDPGSGSVTQDQQEKSMDYTTVSFGEECSNIHNDKSCEKEIIDQMKQAGSFVVLIFLQAI